jgi:uncharacterized protein (DUF1499 family)
MFEPSRIKLYLKTAALICLLAGVGIALLAMIGPLGVWMGFSDFRRGFGFLQIVNAWADWITIGTLILAVAIAVISKVRSIDNGFKLSGLALIGTLCATLAWLVPESFRPPEGTPPIHDIATDPLRPLQYVAIAPLRADVPNNMDYGVMPDMTPARHIDLQQQAYPDIVPQRFDTSVELVFNQVMAAIENLGWEVVDANLAQGRIEATDTTFWFRFKDDIVIEITADSGGSVLNARSLSRVGTSDVGKNAARLRELFSLL